MPHDFHSLSPDDFQLLVRDLLQAELGIRLETFTQGADQGIDLRGLDNLQHTVIVQCKRYNNIRALLRSVRLNELPKVKRLNPQRYILATTVELNPQRKNELLTALQPFCRSPADIIGAGDLTNLLQLHPDVERRNFKLWLSSALVLDRVIHDGVFGEDEAALARARDRLHRYVRNPTLDRAMSLLEAEGYCIIAGQPGIGKSMLADVILLDYVERQQYEAVQISSSLDEIRTRRNPHRRLIFYFDDFLGKNIVEQLTRNEDRRLVDFIEDVRRTPNWRLVLATREYVYNQAIIKFEALALAGEHLKRCIISLSDYTPLIRARILYNHLYYSGIALPYLQALLKDRQYMEIVRHRNYNPRIVQYMTMEFFSRNVKPSSYAGEFIENLNNPERIWNHAFHRHISGEAQDLLVVLASFPAEAFLSDVEGVFSKYHRRRSSKLLRSISPIAFEDALRELDGDFIQTSHSGSCLVITFSNPSIRDFLNAMLSTSPDIVNDILATAVFFEQISTIWSARLPHTEPARFIGDDVAFANTTRDLIASPSPRIRRRYVSAGRLPEMERAQPIKSERVLSILEIAEELQTDAIRCLVQEIIGEDEKEPFDVTDLGKGALVDVLLRLRKRPGWAAASSRLFPLVREFLWESLQDPDDYKALGAFAAEFALDIAESENVDRRLRIAFGEWSGEVWYSADELWGLHNDVEEIGRAFKISLYDLLIELEERARELEHDEEQKPAKPYSSSHTNSGHEWEEIHALFASLGQQ